MNWLDRTIGWFAPAAGARRARARAAMSAMDGVTRAYDAAKVGRGTSNWVAGGSSANAEIESGLARSRARSRDLMRNDPHARRAIGSLVAASIGVGITTDCAGAPGKLWKLWIKECDYYGLLDRHGQQALEARATFESGECLIVRHRLTASEAAKTKSGVPLQLKVLEADFLDTTKHGPTSSGTVCISGIEYDMEGRRVRFWLYDTHPGDTPMFKVRLQSSPVPAEDVIHLFEPERPGQNRGMPRLASVINTLRAKGEYTEALLMKKKIEACFAVFITSEDENRSLTEKATISTDAAGNSQRVETVSPGMMEYLKPGEAVEFASPNVSSSSDQFVADQLRASAMGAGVTYETVTGDLSRVNFSSMRAGRQDFKALVEQFRWLTFIPMECERVWAWFEEAAYMAGKIRRRGYEVTYTPPRWEYVNPLDDVKTDREEVEAGFTTVSAQIRKRGEDPDTVFAERAKEKERLKELGIGAAPKPAAVPGAVKPPDDKQETPDPETPADEETTDKT